MPPARTTVLAELRAGFQEVARGRGWRSRSPPSPAPCSRCYAQYYALAPVDRRDVYGGAGVFGVLESVAGGGAVLGALVGIRWRPRRPLLTGLLLTLVWPVSAFTFALRRPLVAVVPLAFGAGFGFSLFGIWWETSLVRHIPPHALSRVSAYDWMGSLALLPLGFAMAGPLAAALASGRVLGVAPRVAFVMLALALVPRSTRALTRRTAQPSSSRAMSA